MASTKRSHAVITARLRRPRTGTQQRAFGTFLTNDGRRSESNSDMAMDRRLQLQESNWQICNVTTPANYFHMLRRQVHREFRKPLIVMSPKNLLRHPKAVSNLDEFDNSDANDSLQGIRFKRMIMDKTSTSRSMDPPVEDKVERVIFCSGKVYYDLDESREEASKLDAVKICESSSSRSSLGSRRTRAQALSQRRSRLVPRRAHEHGRLVPRPTANEHAVQALIASGRGALRRSPPAASPATGYARSRPRASRARQRRRQLSQSKKRTCINVFFTRYRPFIHERRVRPSRRRLARLAGRSQPLILES